MKGPAAPKDAEEKKPSFYIMRGKQIAGAPVSEDKGVQFIYLNDGRLLSSAKLVGNISDENIMELLKTTEGFRKRGEFRGSIRVWCWCLLSLRESFSLSGAD